MKAKRLLFAGVAAVALMFATGCHSYYDGGYGYGYDYGYGHHHHFGHYHHPHHHFGPHYYYCD